MTNLALNQETNNLKTLAASFNLYQLQDIPARYKNDYFEHRINCGHKDIPADLLNIKSIEIGLFYECKQDTNYKNEVTYYVDHSFILIKEINSPVLCMLMANSSNKYWLHPYYSLIHKYHGISSYKRNDTIKALKEPNMIGVFNEKKVKDWFNYCYSYITALEDLYNLYNSENEKIEQSIKEFIQNNKGCEVSTYNNITDITAGLFRIRFTHHKDQKYLNTEITFKGTLNDITKINSLM